MQNLPKNSHSVNSLTPQNQAPLGSITKLVNKLPETPVNRRLDRWAMQSASGSLLPSERVSKCMNRVSVFKHPTSANMHNVFSLDYFKKIDIQHSKKKDSFFYSNLMTCGSVWHCPICAAKISEHRKQELEKGTERWRNDGGQVLLLTLTVPHYSGDSLAGSLSGLTLALKKMTNSVAFKKLSKDIGLHGRIRALEVTYGQNGWHPHFHLLLFLYRPISGLGQLQVDILTLWKRACLKSSLAEPNHHGVCVHNGDYAAQYVGKWGLEAEMTKGHIKKSNKGFSPFDLLRKFLNVSKSDFSLAGGGSAAGQLFIEYAKAFKGKKQLLWSQGLRADLLDDYDLTDEEIADSEENDAELFAQIPLDLWRIILRRNARGVVLEKCRQGVAAFHTFLSSLDIHYLPDDYYGGSNNDDSNGQSFTASTGIVNDRIQSSP